MLKRHEGITEQMVIAFHGLMDFLVKHETYYPMLSDSEKSDFTDRIKRTIGEYDENAPQVAVLETILDMSEGRNNG